MMNVRSADFFGLMYDLYLPACPNVWWQFSSAERSVPQIEGAQWQVAERPFGSYTRQLVLGRSLDTDRLEASYHDGVLTVSIPVAEKAKARKIAVTRADTPAAVEAHTIEGEQPSVES